MNYSTFRFTLDLHTMQSQISIPVKYGDTAVRLLISLTDGGVPLAIEDGCRAVFSAKKADNTTILNNCVIEKNSIIRYDFTEHTATAEGIAKCEIILYGLNGEVLGSPRFVIVVDKRVIGGDDVISQSERNAVDQIIILGTEAVANEDDRKANEEARKANEETRVLAEQTRNYYPSLASRVPTFDATTGVMSFSTVDGSSNKDITLALPSQGGGGGDKLYMHYVKISMDFSDEYYDYGFAEIYFHVLSHNNTPITIMNLVNYIPDMEWQSATGYASYETAYGSVDSFYINDAEGGFFVSYWATSIVERKTDCQYYSQFPDSFIVTDEILEVV